MVDSRNFLMFKSLYYIKSEINFAPASDGVASGKAKIFDKLPAYLFGNRANHD
jgi:hypothetical protein